MKAEKRSQQFEQQMMTLSCPSLKSPTALESNHKPKLNINLPGETPQDMIPVLQQHFFHVIESRLRYVHITNNFFPEKMLYSQTTDHYSISTNLERSLHTWFLFSISTVSCHRVQIETTILPDKSIESNY